MAVAKLKSLYEILNDSLTWEAHGSILAPYYHIQVTDNLKIGFRGPYKSYLGTEVEVVKKVDRRKNVIPGLYSVLSRRGRPLFSAHRSWFSFIQYDVPAAIVLSTRAMHPEIDELAPMNDFARLNVEPEAQSGEPELTPALETEVRHWLGWPHTSDAGPHESDDLLKRPSLSSLSASGCTPSGCTPWNVDETEWVSEAQQLGRQEDAKPKFSELTWDQLFEV